MSTARSSERRANPSGEPGVAPATSFWGRPTAFAAAFAVGMVAVYLMHPLLADYRFPVGPDGAVYTWFARLASAEGFADTPGGGPGVVGAILTLAGGIGASSLSVVTAMGPVLAACCGLAAGSLVESALGADRLRAAVATAFTSAFAAYLAGGWLANVAMVAVFLCAVGALAVSTRSWRAVGLAGGLLAAAGLTHRFFFVIALAVLAGAVILGLREAAARVRRGERVSSTLAARVGIALLAGGAVAGAGLAAIVARQRSPGDTSQDGFFRRQGLREFLLVRYRERLAGDAIRAAVPLVTGAGLALPRLGRWRGPAEESSESARFVRRLVLVWAVATAAGVAILAVTAWGPPNRILQFAFFVPVAAAAGAPILLRADGGRRIVGVLAGLLFVAGSMVGWFRQAPSFAPEELAAARTLGRAVADLPADTPIVVIVDTDEEAAGYHLTRFGNVLRMGLPGERIRDLSLAVGDPADVQAGNVRRSGDDEHDLISKAYLEEVSPLLPRAAIFVVREFNKKGYAHLEGSSEVAPGVLRLDAEQEPIPVTTDAGGLGPLETILGTVLAIGALWLLGAGWARWGLVGVSPLGAALAAAPAGIGVAVLGSVAGDLASLRPGGAGSLVLVGALAAAGYLLLLRPSDG